MQPRIGSAVLVEHEGKILLGKRNKANCYGQWVIPGGGVDWGETIEDAGIREIKEETNLDVNIVKRLGYKEIVNLPGQYHSVVFFHLAKAKHFNLQAKEDLSEVKFFTVEEIKQLPKVDSVEWAIKQAGLWSDESYEQEVLQQK
jgi:8-oxo-dGTP diphosphatase